MKNLFILRFALVLIFGFGSVSVIFAQSNNEVKPKTNDKETKAVVVSSGRMQELKNDSNVKCCVNLCDAESDKCELRIMTFGEDPVILVDGKLFEGKISDLKPSQIESIEVLKDEASKATYGSKGAILIHTVKAVN